ncbi:MAG: heat-inducible transcription repressor HrcA [Ruminococcaceae bacterium]|nr:heat-inducible transcription repressor HrcA [Oscillospiraceae bacterium]MBD5116171.1 heat-inducible transcription repressor HrcA [Oscillospiraceae bacterium]
MEKRALKILETVVDEYIRTGEPVGSKTVQEKLTLKISSATIRNEMAMLEQLGYLEHPHTSAGRVPTFSGYRLYIETFMPENTLSRDEKERIDEIFEDIGADTDEQLIEAAGRALSEVTKCAIVTANETGKFSVITKVEVIPTGRRMYVLLLVTSGGSIKNRVCRLQFDLTHEQVQFFTKFADENLTGLNLENLSDEFMENLSSALGGYMMMLSPLMKGIAEMSAEMVKEQVSMNGEANLIACDQLESREIAAILQNREKFSEILSGAFSGINILFGQENQTFVVSNSSIITASFEKDGHKAGSFGVIGPARIDYKKIIPYLEYFSNKITNLLSEGGEESEVGSEPAGLLPEEKEAKDIE